MPPTVTIGIPCYNAARWIAQSVGSALAQTWPEREVIVVDDGSTDETLEILKRFGAAIHIVEGPHAGANHARNLILQNATGTWLQYVDADDYLRPEKIARQLAETPDVDATDVIYSPILIEEWNDGRPLPPTEEPLDASADIYTQLLRWQLPQTSGGLWRTEIMRDISGWDEDPTQLCDEHDCYFRALKSGARFHFAPTTNAVYRQWSEETRSKSNQRPVIASRTALCEALREWLIERGAWTPGHEAALGQSLLEMARKLAADDLDFATSYHAARKSHIRLAGPAAPPSYQIAYRAFGFRAAELLARAMR